MEVQGGPGTAFGSWGPEIGTQRGDGNQDSLRVGKPAPSLTCMCEGGRWHRRPPKQEGVQGKLSSPSQRDWARPLVLQLERLFRFTCFPFKDSKVLGCGLRKPSSFLPGTQNVGAQGVGTSKGVDAMPCWEGAGQQRPLPFTSCSSPALGCWAPRTRAASSRALQTPPSAARAGSVRAWAGTACGAP